MKTTVNISEIVQTRIWVTMSDGQKINKIVSTLLNGGGEVELSFADKEFMTTSFLGAAIGSFYCSDYDTEKVSRLSFIDTTAKDVEKINRVIANAKRAGSDDGIRGNILDKEVQL